MDTELFIDKNNHHHHDHHHNDDNRSHFRIDWRQLSYYQTDFKFQNPFKFKSSHEPINSINNPNNQSGFKSSSLCYATRQRKILKSISGHFKSGQISAILGQSGCGKTTLLSSLFGQKQDKAFGKTRVTWYKDKNHSVPLRQEASAQDDYCDDVVEARKLKVCFKAQKDNLIEELTVYESLMFASKLKNSKGSKQQRIQVRAFNGPDYYDKLDHKYWQEDRHEYEKFHQDNVNKVVKQLKLKACLHTKCSKISGGEYKRLSIGQELLSQPDVIVLDEPTTGLDSLSCESICKTLKSMVRGKPISIILTIHQPDVEIFHLFDQVYALSHDGRVIYEGPPSRVMRTLKSVGLQLSLAEPAEEINTARLLVEIGSNDGCRQLNIKSTPANQGDDPVGRLFELQKSSYATEHSSQNGNATRPIAQDDDDYRTVRDFDICLNRSSNIEQGNQHLFWYHSPILMHRNWLTITRNRLIISIQVMMHVLIPLLFSLVFKLRTEDACPNMDNNHLMDLAFSNITEISAPVLETLDKARDVITNIRAVYVQLYIMNLAIGCMTSMIYPADMHVLKQEYRNGWYSMSSYFVARSLTDLPISFTLQTISTFMILYLSENACSLEHSLQLLLLVLIGTICSQSWGLVAGALFMGSYFHSLMACACVINGFFVISGSMIRVHKYAGWAQLLSKLNYLCHLTNGYVILRYGFGRCPCKEEDFDVETLVRNMTTIASLFNAEMASSLDNSLQPFDNSNSIENLNSKQQHQLYKLEQVANSTMEATNNKIKHLVRFVGFFKRVFSYNSQLNSCEDVKPFLMLEFRLTDDDIYEVFLMMIVLAIVMRLCVFSVIYSRIRLFI